MGQNVGERIKLGSSRLPFPQKIPWRQHPSKPPLNSALQSFLTPIGRDTLNPDGVDMHETKAED